jgi:lysophospholipase L1-like esterase
MSRRTSNNALSYGAVAARALKAEFVCIAWSGRKLWPDTTLPEVHDLTLAPWDNAPKWDFSWVPQAVVVNLGSNDYGKGIPEEKGWTEAYAAFIDQLRKHYPQSHVFCCLCATILGKEREPMGRLTRGVVERLKARGDRKVHYVELPPMSGDGIGPGWHPTVKCHAAMGEMLAKAIASELKW